MLTYHEHEKLARISERSQLLGEWLEWLFEQGYHIAEHRTSGGGYEGMFTVNKSVNNWLAAFYDIDLKKIDEEKKQMLRELQALHPQSTIRNPQSEIG